MQKDYSKTLQTIKGELNKADVDHQVATKQYEAVMLAIKDKYGFTTLEEVEKEITALRAEIPEAENRRNAMLAEAQGILQEMGVGGSDGNTKKAGAAKVGARRQVASPVAGTRGVRGQIPAATKRRVH